MKLKLLKSAALAGLLAAFGLFYMMGAQAQQSPNGSNTSITTNWVGCMVVGKNDTFDPMARGAHPTAIQQVEIGLRSDGVVIWRGVEQSK